MYYEDIKLKQSTYAIISFNDWGRLSGAELAVWYPGGLLQGLEGRQGWAAGSNHSGYMSLSALPRPAPLTFHQRNQFLKCAQL